MRDLRFEWDEAKNATNQRKHGVSFEEARSVFYDERALLIEDPDEGYGEDRFVLLGARACGCSSCATVTGSERR